MTTDTFSKKVDCNTVRVTNWELYGANKLVVSRVVRQAAQPKSFWQSVKDFFVARIDEDDDELAVLVKGPFQTDDVRLPPQTVRIGKYVFHDLQLRVILNNRRDPNDFVVARCVYSACEEAEASAVW